MGLLENKTAIVTGSSRGIGAEVAKILAAEGAAVVVNYRQKAPRANKVVAEIEADGGRAAAIGADLTTQEGVQALASAAMENFGSLDLLVLNASGGMETGMEEGYALKLNRDAQVNMLNAAVAAHARRLARGLRDQPPGPLHRHGAHHARVRARGPQQARRRGRTPRHWSRTWPRRGSRSWSSPAT